MKLADLSSAEISARLRQQGLSVRLGPFQAHLRSNLPELVPLLQQLYAHYPLLDATGFADFHLHYVLPFSVRRWWRPKLQLVINGSLPLAPVPRAIALANLEWGINWCVYTCADHYLMLHTGVVAKHDYALLLPGHPGAGKSTLSVALAHRGWRFLSDEFGLVRPADLLLDPFPRLTPLKNASIAVIRDYLPEAVLGPDIPGTRKGTIAHVRPPADSVARAHEPAIPTLIVFPRYQAGTASSLTPLSRIDTFVQLSGHAFNYERIGLTGFETLTRLVDTCPGYSLVYSDLDDAIARLDELMSEIRADVEVQSHRIARLIQS